MKNLIKGVLMVLLAMQVSPILAQDYTIEFDQTLESDNPEMATTIDMMGSMTSLWYMSGNKFRSETSAGMTGTTTVIYDGDEGDLLLLMENPFMGKTYTKVLDTSETEEVIAEIVKMDETRTIAGYDCVKYTSTDTSGIETILFVADALEAPSYSQYDGKINGTILCTITEINSMGTQMTMTMTASKVTEGPVDAEKFSMEIPEGFTEFDLGE